MRKSVRKFFRYTALCVAIISAISFIIVYQEFGPIDHRKLVEHKVRDAGLVANFMYPKGRRNLPLIIALGGSGGGFLPDKEMQALALHGHAVLSVAYFKAEGLPGKIENIPLEYFRNAIRWGTDQPPVDSGKVVVLGVSRGAELALLLASIYPQVKGVVAYAPGCFILPNAVDTEDNIASHSSWTWKGKPLAFAPLRILEDNTQKVISYRNYIEPLLKDVNKQAYTINLENAKGPILFLSGSDDQTWPSMEMANILEQRLRDKQYPYNVHNLIFPNAGHWLFQFQDNYQVISSTFFRVVRLNIRGEQYRFNNGGSSWATMMGRRKAREATLKFLDQFR